MHLSLLSTSNMAFVQWKHMNWVEIPLRALRNCQHYLALDLLLHLETYLLYKHFEQWNKSQQMKNVINDPTIAKINQQSAEAVYYHVKQTGLRMAVSLTTGFSKRYAVDISRKDVLVDFTSDSLFLVDMSSNSLPPSEKIQKISCSDIRTVKYLSDVCTRIWSFTCDCNQQSFVLTRWYFLQSKL